MCSPPRVLQGLFLVALFGLAGCGAAAIDEMERPSPSYGSSDDRPREERRRFDRVYSEWRGLVGELAAVDLQYQSAPEHRRDALRERYDQLVAEGTAAQKEVLQAAVVAYAKAPEENIDLATFLTAVVFLLVDREEYEESLRLAQILLDGEVSSDELYALAGTAAFATGNFELAEKHLRRVEREQTMPGVAAKNLKDIDYYKTAGEREKKLRSAETSAGDLPRVLLKTTQGEIELDLFENEAPNTVANFVWLVEQGFYDGLTFHRVLPRLMAQAGCPNGDGSGGPGYTIPCECYREDHRLHFRGSLAMAHSGRDTGGSQFYLTFVPLRRLDGNHTVFGRVVRGIDVLARLQRRDPPDPFSRGINPHRNIVIPPADKIIAAKVLKKRNHPYRPKVFQATAAAENQPSSGS